MECRCRESGWKRWKACSLCTLSKRRSYMYSRSSSREDIESWKNPSRSLSDRLSSNIQSWWASSLQDSSCTWSVRCLRFDRLDSQACKCCRCCRGILLWHTSLRNCLVHTSGGLDCRWCIGSGLVLNKSCTLDRRLSTCWSRCSGNSDQDTLNKSQSMLFLDRLDHTSRSFSLPNCTLYLKGKSGCRCWQSQRKVRVHSCGSMRHSRLCFEKSYTSKENLDSRHNRQRHLPVHLPSCLGRSESWCLSEETSRSLPRMMCTCSDLLRALMSMSLWSGQAGQYSILLRKEARETLPFCSRLIVESKQERNFHCRYLLNISKMIFHRLVSEAHILLNWWIDFYSSWQDTHNNWLGLHVNTLRSTWDHMAYRCLWFRRSNSRLYKESHLCMRSFAKHIFFRQDSSCISWPNLCMSSIDCCKVHRFLQPPSKCRQDRFCRWLQSSLFRLGRTENCRRRSLLCWSSRGSSECKVCKQSLHHSMCIRLCTWCRRYQWRIQCNLRNKDCMLFRSNSSHYCTYTFYCQQGLTEHLQHTKYTAMSYKQNTADGESPYSLHRSGPKLQFQAKSQLNRKCNSSYLARN